MRIITQRSYATRPANKIEVGTFALTQRALVNRLLRPIRNMRASPERWPPVWRLRVFGFDPNPRSIGAQHDMQWPVKRISAVLACQLLGNPTANANWWRRG